MKFALGKARRISARMRRDLKFMTPANDCGPAQLTIEPSNQGQPSTACVHVQSAASERTIRKRMRGSRPTSFRHAGAGSEYGREI